MRMLVSTNWIRVWQALTLRQIHRCYWLERKPKRANLRVMKFILSCVVYVGIGVVLGAAIMKAVNGHPWWLVISALAYVIAFARIGCISH